ncbi:hypothetical protein E4U54_008466 [Claviceps lovelessii]|nr:hypothetical protein E4U54_008466 [Claviceps lovelessii]
MYRSFTLSVLRGPGKLAPARGISHCPGNLVAWPAPPRSAALTHRTTGHVPSRPHVGTNQHLTLKNNVGQSAVRAALNSPAVRDAASPRRIGTGHLPADDHLLTSFAFIAKTAMLISRAREDPGREAGRVEAGKGVGYWGSLGARRFPRRIVPKSGALWLKRN